MATKIAHCRHSKPSRRPSSRQNHQIKASHRDQINPLLKRREVLFFSFNSLIIGDALLDSTDGRTVVNSLLGAYGLPQLKAASGYKFYDDFDNDYTFEYPKSYVGRKNSLRTGLYLSDFNTTDKVVVETFPLSDISKSSNTLVEAAVSKLINPANDVGGDSKLFLPAANRIKTETKTLNSDGTATANTTNSSQVYTYIAFPSETITRSGYQIRRKNLAVVSVKKGMVYVLGASARSDQWNKDKQEMLQHVVESFRLRYFWGNNNT